MFVTFVTSGWYPHRPRHAVIIPVRHYTECTSVYVVLGCNI